MDNKFIEIQVPDGYEVDTEKSTFTKVIFKMKALPKTWEDLLGSEMPKTSCSIKYCSIIPDLDCIFKNANKDMYIDRKHAKSALAMAQISQLMPYYGGEITNEEWEDNSFFKYNIERYKNTVYLDGHSTMYTFLAFHTEQQCKSFLNNNEQLVNDYLMITK